MNLTATDSLRNNLASLYLFFFFFVMEPLAFNSGCGGYRNSSRRRHPAAKTTFGSGGVGNMQRKRPRPGGENVKRKNGG